MIIHETAIIHPDADLAEDVEVQAYTLIGPEVKIGAGTVIGPHSVIDGRTTIGVNNRFHSGNQIGVPPQDLKHQRQLLGRCEVGDNNEFREHVSISACRMTSEDDDHRVTAVGSNCMFMTGAHVGHDSRVGDNVVLANAVCLAGHVEIHDGVTLGGLSGVHQDCVVGTMTFIGGLARITRDAPPYMLVEGNPSRVHGPNAVGLQRNGFDAAARARIKKMYKIVYRSNLNTTQALHEIENSVEDTPERRVFLDFVRKSVRGIIK